MSGRDLKIGLSFGLVVVALLNAFAVVAGNQLAPRIERSLGMEPIHSYHSAEPTSINWDEHSRRSDLPLGRTLPGNPAARAEIKHGGPIADSAIKGQAPCIPCYPSYPVATPARNTSQVTPLATAPRKNLIIFVGTDATSQAVLSWFNYDADLVKLKQGVNFQAYTKDNPLYRSRYQEAVPVEYFPAILFLDEKGGHIHAAYGPNLPRDSKTLYGDLGTAYRLQQQIMQQRQFAPATLPPAPPQPIALPTSVSPLGIEFQNASGPELLIRAENSDCVGPNCPNDRQPDRDRVFPFFNRDPANPLDVFQSLRLPKDSLVIFGLGECCCFSRVSTDAASMIWEWFWLPLFALVTWIAVLRTLRKGE